MQSSEMFLFEKNVLPRSFTLDYSSNFLDLPFLSAWSWSRPPDDRARPESREKTAILDNPRSGVVLPVGIRLSRLGRASALLISSALARGKYSQWNPARRIHLWPACTVWPWSPSCPRQGLHGAPHRSRWPLLLQMRMEQVGGGPVLRWCRPWSAWTRWSQRRCSGRRSCRRSGCGRPATWRSPAWGAFGSQGWSWPDPERVFFDNYFSEKYKFLWLKKCKIAKINVQHKKGRGKA